MEVVINAGRGGEESGCSMDENHMLLASERSWMRALHVEYMVEDAVYSKPAND